MKKQTVSLLALLLAASGFLSSCHNRTNKDIHALKFDSIQVNETAHLFGDTAKPACNLAINFAHTVQSADVRMKDSLNSFFLAACFGDKYLMMTPEEAVRSYTEKYISNYRKDLEPMYQKDEQNQDYQESIGAWYSYYKGIEGHVQSHNSALLTYRIYYNEYTGGAHGIYMTTYLNLDLKRLIPLRLDDLFVVEYKEALTAMLWTQLMADNEVDTRQELEDMGYATTGNLEPVENFYLDSKGITFHYNVYDIAPYVMGATQITLPYEAIAPLMNEEFVALSNVLKRDGE